MLSRMLLISFSQPVRQVMMSSFHREVNWLWEMRGAYFSHTATK